MIEHTLRKGDMLVTTKGVAILTKKTKEYWHYFYRGKIARIRKKKLWGAIDRSVFPCRVEFGSTMKRRRKQKKNRTLDLHGTPHENADEEIRKFLNWVELPANIITGNSSAMKVTVHRIAKEYDWVCYEKDTFNDGELIIREE